MEDRFTTLRSDSTFTDEALAAYFQLVIDTMKAVCAPVRDEAIRDLLENSAKLHPAQIFQRILRLLELMQYDAINFQIQSIRPKLLQYGPEYERNAFRRHLQDGSVSVQQTTLWLKAAYEKVQTESSKRDPEHVNHPSQIVQFETVYLEAVVDLLTKSKAMTLPETFRWDLQRVLDMRRSYKDVSTAAAILTLSRTVFPRAMRDEARVKQALSVLFPMLSVPVRDKKLLSEKIAQAIVESVGSDCTLEEKQQRVGVIQGFTEKILKDGDDPVYKVMERRIQQAILKQLSGSAPLVSDRSGLGIVAGKLQPLLAQVERLVRWNRSVYSPWYDEILRHVSSGDAK